VGGRGPGIEQLRLVQGAVVEEVDGGAGVGHEGGEHGDVEEEAAVQEFGRVAAAVVLVAVGELGRQDVASFHGVQCQRIPSVGSCSSMGGFDSKQQ